MRDFTVLNFFWRIVKNKTLRLFFWRRFSSFPVAKCLNIENLITCSRHYDRSPSIMSCFALLFHFQAVFARHTLILWSVVF